MAENTLLPVAEAQARIIDAMPLLPGEQISIAEGLGRTLSTDLVSRRIQPPVAMSAMDGFAVKSDDISTLPTSLKVIGHAPAGNSFDGLVGKGEAVRIFTGAPMPNGTDAVVIQENTKYAGETVHVIQGEISPGQFVRPAGLDFSMGDVLLSPGHTLTARDIGLAAAMNVPWLMVHRKPRISILATGDEIVMPGDPVGRDQIVSSNGLCLAAFVTAMGGDSIDLGIAPDEEKSLSAIASGSQGSDILVTTGGASVGDHDLVQTVLGDMGLSVNFWRIAMRPGKPLIFGKFNGTFLIGLPGNPVSSIVCAIVFLGPAIRKMLGTTPVLPQTVQARLGNDLPENDEREDYLRATLLPGENGSLIATAYQKQDSSMFATVAQADALIIRSPHAATAKSGDPVNVIPLLGGHYRI